MISGAGFLYYCSLAVLIMLLISMVLALWRMARGPTAADRVIALDLLSVLVVAFLVAVSVYAREAAYLDVAIAYACIAFLGTIALARFIMRAIRKPGDRTQGGEIHD
jgi:multicomponent Na+:H+ antiporter subunit F